MDAPGNRESQRVTSAETRDPNSVDAVLDDAITSDGPDADDSGHGNFVGGCPAARNGNDSHSADELIQAAIDNTDIGSALNNPEQTRQEDHGSGQDCQSGEDRQGRALPSELAMARQNGDETWDSRASHVREEEPDERDDRDCREAAAAVLMSLGQLEEPAAKNVDSTRVGCLFGDAAETRQAGRGPHLRKRGPEAGEPDGPNKRLRRDGPKAAGSSLPNAGRWRDSLRPRSQRSNAVQDPPATKTTGGSDADDNSHDSFPGIGPAARHDMGPEQTQKQDIQTSRAGQGHTPPSQQTSAPNTWHSRLRTRPGTRSDAGKANTSLDGCDDFRWDGELAGESGFEPDESRTFHGDGGTEATDSAELGDTSTSRGMPAARPQSRRLRKRPNLRYPVARVAKIGGPTQGHTPLNHHPTSKDNGRGRLRPRAVHSSIERGGISALGRSQSATPVETDDPDAEDTTGPSLDGSHTSDTDYGKPSRYKTNKLTIGTTTEGKLAVAYLYMGNIKFQAAAEKADILREEDILFYPSLKDMWTSQFSWMLRQLKTVKNIDKLVEEAKKRPFSKTGSSRILGARAASSHSKEPFIDNKRRLVVGRTKKDDLPVVAVSYNRGIEFWAVAQKLRKLAGSAGEIVFYPALLGLWSFQLRWIIEQLKAKGGQDISALIQAAKKIPKPPHGTVFVLGTEPTPEKSRAGVYLDHKKRLVVGMSENGGQVIARLSTRGLLFQLVGKEPRVLGGESGKIHFHQDLKGLWNYHLKWILQRLKLEEDADVETLIQTSRKIPKPTHGTKYMLGATPISKQSEKRAFLDHRKRLIVGELKKSGRLVAAECGDNNKLHFWPLQKKKTAIGGIGEISFYSPLEGLWTFELRWVIEHLKRDGSDDLGSLSRKSKKISRPGHRRCLKLGAGGRSQRKCMRRQHAS